MIQQQFLKRQIVPSSYKPIAESISISHGVSYNDENRVKIKGPSYQSKYGEVRMSKHDLSVKQLDERTDYYKSKVESLSMTMTE